MKFILQNDLYARIFQAKQSCFTFHSAVVETEGIPNYVAFISRIDNPKLKDVLSEFATEIQSFINKPE